MVHHTKNKGDLGILKAQLDLFKQGYSLYFPLSEHEPFDIVAYKDHKFLRIQDSMGITLRITDTKNNQHKNVKLSKDYKFCSCDATG